MATIRANGECIVEMVIRKSHTDNAEADEMRMDIRKTYRAMSSGKILKKIDSICDYGTGGEPVKHPGSWTVAGKIKKEVFERGNRAIFEAMQSWCDQLIQKGIDAEIS